MAKRILCYGDSNTFGLVTGKKPERLEARFPKLLAEKLSSGHVIIEEGLISRTLHSDDRRPRREGRDGSGYLIPCLDSHDPLDVIVLMLGTNEMKEAYAVTPEEIGRLLEEHFVKVIRSRMPILRGPTPRLLIVSPPLIDETAEWAATRYKGAAEKSRRLAPIFKAIAERNACAFIDASEMEVSADGVHMTAKGHKKLAGLLAEKIRETL